LIEMLESPANRTLSLSAKRALERIEIELAHHGGQDNGRLPVTYDDFHSYGIHRHAIRPAIRECVALGFLEITRPGRAGNADFRIPNLFRLTYRETKGLLGDGTHEWRKVADLAEAERIAKAARQNPKRTKRQQKNKTPVTENANFQCGNRHRKRKNHSTESITTVHGTESALLSISRGGGEQ
jgi:hypothetical protein